jgi:hypothetical protein
MRPVGLFPLPDEDVLGDLFLQIAEALRAHRFTDTGRLPRPGGPWHAFFDPENLRRYMRGGINSHEMSGLAPLYYWDFSRKHPDTLPLFEAFGINRVVPKASLQAALPPELLTKLIEREVLIERDGGWQSRLTVTPVGSKLFFHDDNRIHVHEKMDHVFCGRCSMRLVARVAEVGATRRFTRGLDLCTGSGVQGLSMSGSCDEVVLGDVNPRALAYARANARVNGVTNSRTVLSDLFSEIDGKFDIITANTPFLLLQEGSKALSGYGGHLGMEVELRLYQQLDERLMPGGISLVVASSAIVRGENVLATRLREIFRGKGYEIDLVPINTYYEDSHHELYRSLSVDKCILYVVVAKKTGTELILNVHPWTPIKNIAYELEVARKRLKGWASSRRSQGGSARP